MIKIKKLNKHLNLCLTIITAFLLCTFIFSSISKNKTDKRKKISTALLNPKYVNELTKIELKGNEGEIYLQKKDNIWTVKTSENDFAILANTKIVSDFIDTLSKIINVYKITDLSTSNHRILFPDNASFSVKYFLNDNNNTTLYFGKYDFSQNFRYLMTDKNTSIYEVNPKLDRFLNTSLQIWSEPNLISQNILGKISSSDIQRIVFTEPETLITRTLFSSTENKNSFDEIKQQLLDLRHGGKLSKNVEISLNAESLLKIELGNKKDIILEFYPIINTKEYAYLVKIFYDEYTLYNYKISQWTYNKIKEMML